MAIEVTAFGAPLNRPRPLLFVLLGGVIVVVVLMKLGGSAAPDPPPANPSAAAPQAKEPASPRIDASALDVKLEALTAERPEPRDAERNPFRFKPKPAPPPPPAPKPTPREEVPVGPPPPPPLPPITVKFIGTLELPQGGMVAIFTDCTVGRRSVPVREGATIFGQYRLVKVGLQSVVVEYLDGRGRTTLPKTGQECVK